MLSALGNDDSQHIERQKHDFLGNEIPNINTGHKKYPHRIGSDLLSETVQ